MPVLQSLKRYHSASKTNPIHMRREPKKAESLVEAYYELTKPSITFMILISTALGYYMGGNGIANYIHFSTQYLVLV